MSGELALSVVIPTLGARPSLGRVLDGFAAQGVDPERFELILGVDRATERPREAEALLAERPYATRAVIGTRPGASANRNAAAAAAAAELLLFTDDDTVPHADLIERHLDAHARNPAPADGVLGHVRWAPELRLTPFMRWLDQGVQFAYPHIVGTEAGWGRFYTANVSVKRELFERVGGFDEVNLPYLYEDLDFAYRADRLGFRLLYERRAVADHLGAVTLEDWLERMDRLAAAERRFVELHPDVEPYFHRMFTDAAARPPARGRGRRLAGVVPRRTPLLGEPVWNSADLYFRQTLARRFLLAWERAGAAGPGGGSAG